MQGVARATALLYSVPSPTTTLLREKCLHWRFQKWLAMTTPPFLYDQLEIHFSKVFNPEKNPCTNQPDLLHKEKQIISHKSSLRVNPFSLWSDQVTSFHKSLSKAPVNEGSAPTTVRRAASSHLLNFAVWSLLPLNLPSDELNRLTPFHF